MVFSLFNNIRKVCYDLRVEYKVLLTSTKRYYIFRQLLLWTPFTKMLYTHVYCDK
jgi:hypothetical protein